MSDPAANVEIEDVLASVRRLVSTTRREPEHGPAPESEPDKLVLTADFRVRGAAPELEHQPELGFALADTEAGHHAEPAMHGDEQPSHFEVSEDADPPQAEAYVDADTSPDEALEDAETPENGECHDAGPADDAGDTDELAVGQADWDRSDEEVSDDAAQEAEGSAETAQQSADESAEAVHTARILTLEERIAQLEAAVTAHSTVADFEPDGSEDQDQHIPHAIVGHEAADTPDDRSEDLRVRFTTALSDAEEPGLADATGSDTDEGDAADADEAGRADATEADTDEADVANADEGELADTDGSDDGKLHEADLAGADAAEDASAEATETPFSQDGFEFRHHAEHAARIVAALNMPEPEKAEVAAEPDAEDGATHQEANETPPDSILEAEAILDALTEEEAPIEPDVAAEDDTTAEGVVEADADDSASEPGFASKPEAEPEAEAVPEAVPEAGPEGTILPPDPLSLYADEEATGADGDPVGDEEPAEIAGFDDTREPEFLDNRTVPFPSRVQRIGETDAERPNPSDQGQDHSDWEDRIYNFDPDTDVGGLDFDNDTQEIDEEMLRDMVAEIVRQELQGALGERITRNVRKLVRREIMRALSIREFE